jgi:hypothetical protein
MTMTYPKILAQILTLPNGSGTPIIIQGPIETVNEPRVIRGNTLDAIINTVIPFAIAFAGIGLLLVIISGGFTLLTSAGDAKKMESGKHQITNGVIGFVIIILAYWLVQIAGTILGIDSIKTIF